MSSWLIIALYSPAGRCLYTFLDMNPPKYVTAEYTSLGQTFLLTIQVTPTAEGTLIKFLYGKPFEGYADEDVEFFQKGADETAVALTLVIQEVIRNGKASPDQIAARNLEERLIPGLR